jgi:cysteine-rich CPCC protein
MEPQRLPYRCPCCGYLTLPARGEYDICPVCFWEDDDPQEEFGQPAPERPEGPNHVHLWQAAQLCHVRGFRGVGEGVRATTTSGRDRWVNRFDCHIASSTIKMRGAVDRASGYRDFEPTARQGAAETGGETSASRIWRTQAPVCGKRPNLYTGSGRSPDIVA